MSAYRLIEVRKAYPELDSMCTWNTPGGALELESGEIHLWQADLASNTKALPVLEQTLAADELAKAGQFRLEADRRRYVFAHGALRTILARYLNTTPGALAFRYGSLGKPKLAKGTVRFTMSHSHNLVVCAISRARHVGVDVERVRRDVGTDVARCFCPGAFRLLERLSLRARHRAFFQGWTRLEAWSKARGEGLSLGLETFEDFLCLSDRVLLPAVGDAARKWRWRFHDFSPRRGYMAALAARRANFTLKYWTWQAQDMNTIGRFAARDDSCDSE
jgi:4'-phosphopantetheinyl transferase